MFFSGINSYISVVWFACAQNTLDQDGSTDAMQDVSTVVESIDKEMHEHGVDVTLSVSPKEPQLGDSIQLVLSVEATADTQITMPSFGEAIGRFQIIDFTPKEKKQTESTLYRQEYTLQPMNSGLITIPAQRIEYSNTEGTGEIITEEISLQIQSMLPTDSELVFLPSRPRLEPLSTEPTWLYAVGGMLTVLGLLLLHRLWKGRKLPEKEISAFEQAWFALRALESRQEEFKREENLDVWFAELSMITRQYLEHRYDISALDKTTPELLMGFPQWYREHNIPTEQQVFLSEFFPLCDSIQFAKVPVEFSVALEYVQKVRWYIETTRFLEDTP